MIASPLRPRHRQEQGIAAASRLAHRGTPYGASLSFATTTHLWPLSDPPSRKPTSRPVATSRQRAARSIPGRALASSMLDSPCQGSRTGLTPPISTSVPSTHGLVAPPGLLTHHARTPLPSSLVDRQNSMAIDQHYLGGYGQSGLGPPPVPQSRTTSHVADADGRGSDFSSRGQALRAAGARARRLPRAGV